MAKYAKKLSVGISLFLCSTNCMLLNTVHRGRWEYIARSIIIIMISIIIIVFIIVIIIIGVIDIVIGCYNTCYDLNVITMFWRFWQKQWLSTHSQTAASAVWRVLVHDGRCSQEKFLFSRQSALEFLSSARPIAVFTKLILKPGFIASS